MSPMFQYLDSHTENECDNIYHGKKKKRKRKQKKNIFYPY
jgi:hypothetical protein